MARRPRDIDDWLTGSWVSGS